MERNRQQYQTNNCSLGRLWPACPKGEVARLIWWRQIMNQVGSRVRGESENKYLCPLLREAPRRAGGGGSRVAWRAPRNPSGRLASLAGRPANQASLCPQSQPVVLSNSLASHFRSPKSSPLIRPTLAAKLPLSIVVVGAGGSVVPAVCCRWPAGQFGAERESCAQFGATNNELSGSK